MPTSLFSFGRLIILTRCDVPIISNIAKQHTTPVLRLSDRWIDASCSLSVRQHSTDFQCFNKTFGGRAIKHEITVVVKNNAESSLKPYLLYFVNVSLAAVLGGCFYCPLFRVKDWIKGLPLWAQHMVIVIEQHVADHGIMICVNHSSRHALS